MYQKKGPPGEQPLTRQAANQMDVKDSENAKIDGQKARANCAAAVHYQAHHELKSH